MTLTVITGAPCTGKSTYVRTHAKPGDIVVDYDLLAVALGSPDSHDHPDPIRYVTAVARRAAVDAALRQHAEGRADVWIIDSKPAKRIAAYEAAGAVWVTLSESKDVLHKRAHAERPKRWHRLIEAWQSHEVTSIQVEGSRSW